MSLSKPSGDINPTDPGEIEDVPESVHMVMNLEELRDMIVAQVILGEYNNNIYNPYKNLDKAIRDLRLVSKNWQLSVSKVLYKNKLPLITFDVSRNRRMEAEEYAEILDKFVKRFSSAFSANSRNAPTYNLQLHPYFIEEGRFPVLQQCLVQCGKGLVKMNVPLRMDGELPDTLPKFALPNLKNLGFRTDNWDPEPRAEYEIFKIKAGNVLRHLLEGSTSLEILNLTNYFSLNTLGFQNDTFVLPSTLAELWITAYTRNDLEMLSRNPLPKLSVLHLTVKRAPISGGLFFNMLRNWRKTLKILNLWFNRIPGKMQLQMCFPVMENLETFEFTAINSKPIQSSGSLQLCFPNLNSLKLHLTEPNFQTWCVNSVFGLVETLKIHMSRYLPMNLQSIRLTSVTYPNVTTLQIEVSERDTSVPEYIFKEMEQLTSLTFCVNYTEKPIANYWDALFIGTTVETAKELQDNLDNSRTVEVPQNTSTPSIRCLRHLTSLFLDAGSKAGNFVNFEGNFLSAVSFIYAFFKMPNLKTLSLGGKFKISDELQEWLKPKMGPNFNLVHRWVNW